jgi:predicted RNase H-like HicB family nuclease
MQKPPFTRSYWVVPGRFLAGCYPGGQTAASAAAKTKGLIDAGVTDIVCLMESSETNHAGHPFEDYMPSANAVAAVVSRNVQWRRHPIVDGGVTTVAGMKAILDDIDAALERGGVAYAHCWGGRGRTGTVVCCWLIRHGLAAPNQAVEKMHTLIGDRIHDFIPTPENDQQRLFVEQWCTGQ